MGGNAFKAIVPHGHFPRMPPPVYNALKTALIPPLKSVYSRVVVAREAPEKADYGDLDIVVSGPREGLTHAAVKEALRAAHSVPMPGPRISNFAIAMEAFEDVANACKTCAAAGEGPAEFASDVNGSVFFQVDVNVCADDVQLERTVFYSSYGDLGLMLGLLVQTAGLSLGIYGLKVRAAALCERPELTSEPFSSQTRSALHCRRSTSRMILRRSSLSLGFPWSGGSKASRRRTMSCAGSRLRRSPARLRRACSPENPNCR